MLKKLLSGRFVLTVIAGIVFSIMALNQILEPKDSLMVIMVVMTSYFNKKRSDESDNEE